MVNIKYSSEDGKRVYDSEYEMYIGEGFEHLKNSYIGKYLKKRGFKFFNKNRPYSQADIYSSKQADDVIMEKIVKPSHDNVIITEYIEGNSEIKEKREIQIGHADFYKAFYLPIWKTLSDSERMRACVWMAEYIIRKQQTPCRISFSPYDEFSDEASGFYMDATKTLFVNFREIKSSTPYNLVTTIAHELEHARQEKIAELNPNKDLTKPDNLYKKSSLMASEKGYDNYYIANFDTPLGYARYKTQNIEWGAETVGLHTVYKYYLLNRKFFGKNKLEENAFLKYMDAALNHKSMCYTWAGSKETVNIDEDVSDGLFTCGLLVKDRKEIEKTEMVKSVAKKRIEKINKAIDSIILNKQDGIKGDCENCAQDGDGLIDLLVEKNKYEKILKSVDIYQKIIFAGKKDKIERELDKQIDLDSKVQPNEGKRKLKQLEAVRLVKECIENLNIIENEKTVPSKKSQGRHPLFRKAEERALIQQEREDLAKKVLKGKSDEMFDLKS